MICHKTDNLNTFCHNPVTRGFIDSNGYPWFSCHACCYIHQIDEYIWETNGDWTELFDEDLFIAMTMET